MLEGHFIVMLQVLKITSFWDVTKDCNLSTAITMQNLEDAKIVNTGIKTKVMLF